MLAETKKLKSDCDDPPFTQARLFNALANSAKPQLALKQM